MKKNYLFFLILTFFLLLLCTYCTKKEKKIEFTTWENVIVEKNATQIGKSEIAGFKRSLFSSLYKIDDIKKGYIDNGFIEKENNVLLKNNITVKLIDIDGKRTNIFIQIMP